MPTWGEILAELNATLAPQGTPDLDAVRRKYLKALADLTGRSTILYATDWLGGAANPNAVSIKHERHAGVDGGRQRAARTKS
jgi:hypothetical protein